MVLTLGRAVWGYRVDGAGRIQCMCSGWDPCVVHIPEVRLDREHFSIFSSQVVSAFPTFLLKRRFLRH